MFFYTEPKPDSRNRETCPEEGFPGFKMTEKEHITKYVYTSYLHQYERNMYFERTLHFVKIQESFLKIKKK